MLIFKPIDLARHQNICVRFRADSFRCSFGSTDRFYEADGSGVEKYLQWLRDRLQALPNNGIHVWQSDQIIGQIELGRWNLDPQVGYVNLFYLIPEARGLGLGQQLDNHAGHFFRELGCTSARLSASPSNHAAMRFYLKHGWVDLGPRPGAPEVHVLEKVYAPMP